MSCNCNQQTNYNICNPVPCQEPQDCSCPTILSTDCVTYGGDDLECSGIKKGTILTELIQQLDAFICKVREDLINAFTLKNIGLGARIYKGVDLLGRKEIRTITKTGDLLVVTENTNDVNLTIDEDALNEAISIDNVGTGVESYKGFNSTTNTHEIRTITKTGDLIVVTQNANDISVSINEANLDTFIEANQKTYTVANVGTGVSVYKDSTTVGNNTQFNLKKLRSNGGTVLITELTDEINFEVVTTPLDINITAGANIVVTEPTPNNFVISSTDNIALLENSATTTITGDGTLGNEYQVDVNNLQKVVSIFPYTLLDGDDKYTIFIDNGVSNVIINVPDTLPSNFSVAFVQKGTGDVTITPTGTSVINSALGYKIKGQYYWALLEKELNTVTYYLIGNTKL